jgi:hopene-associated glycosyltransferase HpnB
MIFLATLPLAVWIYLLAGHGKFWQSGPILQPPALLSPRGKNLPAVSIVVPARNEAETILRALTSLLAQDYDGAFRVILVDDISSDGTGALAGNIEDERLTILRGAPHPRGWSGKLWALSQGIADSDDELLLLTDADIEHRPAHLTTLVAKLQADKLDMVSEMVALNCESLPEHALVPAFVFFFQLLYPFAWVNDPANPMAAAAGGTVLVRAAALERIGGLEAMRGALIDDVTLARRVKAGGRIWLGHSRLASSIRPYKTPGDVWRMVARCAYVQLGYSPLNLAGTVAGMVLIWLLPPLLALFGHGAVRLLGLAAWAAMACSYIPTLRRFRLNPLWSITLPLVAMFYVAATLGSALDHYRGRGVIWKQRAYHG